MPVSEAPNDARDLVRVRFSTGLTDNVAGVNLVRGEAANGCTQAVAERLRAIFGAVVEIVGPWGETPLPAAAHATDAVTPADDGETDAGEPAEANDAPALKPARRRRRRASPPDAPPST